MLADYDTKGPGPRLSLKRRLILVVMLVGLVPLVVATGTTQIIARSNLEQAAFDKLIAVRDSRARHITEAYRFIESQVIELAASRTVVHATLEFPRALRRLPTELGWPQEEEVETASAELRAYYVGPFAQRYQSEAGEAVETGRLLPTADYAIAAQRAYIASNPREVGAKHLLNRPAGDSSSYGNWHAEHHPLLRSFLERFGFHDLFLVDRDGIVVYTVAKEIDFATNLRTGPYRESGLAEAALHALASDRAEVAFVADYVPYVPSYEEPASFIATAVRKGGEIIGAVVLQMPIDRLNAVMTHAAGLGETGETYLVGPDRRMRSDSRFAEESSILATQVDTEASRAALEGNTGHGIIEDYRGAEVLSAWMPLNALGLDYALIAEIDASEAFAPAQRLFWWMVVLTLVLAGAALLVSFLVASSLARPVGEITERLEGLAQQLLSESQEQQAGAAEQSAAVEETRQTFQGLLEASTSMNQIGTDVLGHAEITQRSAQTIGARIQELSTSTTTITEVLALVKDIANKSEILALNAALEGTKAGEAGRGFSLVAQQMQRLAEQVMGSVKKIEGLTGEISGASSSAVLAAEEAEKVSRLTTESAREISGAVGSQQAGAEEVGVAMNEIAQVAGRNVEAARNVVSSSNDLLSLAERLRATVGVKG